jgi:hypothetical protein
MVPCSFVGFTKASKEPTASIPEDHSIICSEKLGLPISTEPIQDHRINIHGHINLKLKKKQ